MSGNAKALTAKQADALFQKTIRQMLADWMDATPSQRAETLKLAAISAAKVARS